RGKWSPVRGSQPRASNALFWPGSVARVGAGESRASSLQGSGEIVCVLTGGAGHESPTKGPTVRKSRRSDVRGAGEHLGGCYPGQTSSVRGVFTKVLRTTRKVLRKTATIMI